LEFAFAREINEHQLEAANFLGLAEIRLASGDMPGTLELLRRLTVVVGKPFQNLDLAAALLERTGHSAEAIEFLDQLVKSAPWDSSYRLRQARARVAAGQDPAAAGRDLASIASASDNPYELRSQAAVALAGRPHGALGSGELDILAENPREVTPTAADRFYFYAARIRAAELASDPEIRVQLLSHCVIDFPRRDQARFPLFASAVSAGSREFALAVVEPLLRAPLGRSRVYAEQAVISRAEDGEEEEGEISTPSARVAANLSPAERAQVAQMIGETLVDLGRLADSLPYFALARRAQESATARKMLDKRISEVKAVLHVELENTARQPVLHAALEQDRIVRPKLTAHAVRPVSATAGAKGVSKR
jgi:cellulose synthase operon protein C